MRLATTSRLFCLTAVAVMGFFPLPAPASEAVFSASQDFKFLELQRDLRENPKGPSARQDLFAMGEYYFQENIPSQAADYFGQLKPSKLKKTEDLLAIVYLARCADRIGNASSVAALKKELEEALSSNFFFAAFDNQKAWSWKSPLGNRFDFSERVDRLEIFCNGNPFYVIDLA